MNRAPLWALAACYWLTVLVVLYLTYPPTDYREGLFTEGQLALAFLEMTSVTWTLGMLMWLVVSRAVGSRPVLAGSMAFVILTLLFYGFGVFEFRAPMAIRDSVTPRFIAAHFFPEYMPLVFSFVSGPLCALALAVIVVIDTRSSIARTTTLESK